MRHEISAVLAGESRWTVIHADNSEVLPALSEKSVAHVITDPPYEAEAHAGARRQTKTHEVVEYEINFAPITEPERIAFAAHAVRAASRWALVFCQVEGVHPWRASLVAAGAKWRRAAAWVKPDCSPQFNGNGWAQGFECIASAWCGSGRSEWNGGGKRGVFTHGVNDFGRMTSGREHPTMKPLPLMLELVELFTDPGDVILDPFAGSGTTGVACLRLGRRFIGIERSEKYAAVATERLRAEQNGLSLRDSRAGQQPLFPVEAP